MSDFGFQLAGESIHLTIPTEDKVIWHSAEECQSLLKKISKSRKNILDSPDWKSTAVESYDKFTREIKTEINLKAKYELLEKKIELLENKIKKLENIKPIIIPVDSLAPEPFKVLNPFNIIIEHFEEGYIASFYDAHLSASGDTQEEAYINLKDIIIGTFEILTEHNKEQLGISSLRQLEILSCFIEKL